MVKRIFYINFLILTFNFLSMVTIRRWTRQEDEILLRQIRAYPQNLAHCFMTVAEVIERSPKACAQHWYKSLSKDPNSLAFCNISAVHLCKNRKNGEGQPIRPNIWQRFLRLIANL